MIIGAQFLRPPTPHEDDWERDLSLAKKTGLTAVRAWMYWSMVNPKPGVWDWSLFDRFFDAAERQGLEVIIQLLIVAPPKWFWLENPEVLIVDPEGHRKVPRDLRAQSIISPCLHQPRTIEAAGEYIRRAAEHYRDRRSLMAWDIWNEYWMQDCYCDEAQKAWQRWLENRYETVESVNQSWKRDIWSFESLRLPDQRLREGMLPTIPAEMLDTFRFRRHKKIDQTRWRAEVLREAKVKAPIIPHFAGEVIWGAADHVDIWGTSCHKPTSIGSSSAVLRYRERAQAERYDLAYASSNGKPWWVAEIRGGPRPGSHHSTGMFFGEPGPGPEEIENSILLPLGFGATGSIFWQWRGECFGQESPNDGLTGINGEPTGRTDAVARVARMLNRHAELFSDPLVPDFRAGLLYDEESLYFAKVNIGAEMPKTDRLSQPELSAYHHALTAEQYPVLWVEPNQLCADGIPEELEILFIPVSYIAVPELGDQLTEWVRKGGVLVAGPLFGLYDETTFVSRPYPPEWAERLFGTKHQDRIYDSEIPVEIVPQMGLGGSFQVLSKHCLETLQPVGAKILGHHGSEVACTINDFGSGKAIRIGGLLAAGSGNSANPDDIELEGEDRDLRRWVNLCCRLAGVEKPVEASGDVIARTFRRANHQLIMLHNVMPGSVVSAVLPKQPCEGPVIDLMTDEVVAETRSGEYFLVSLEGYSTRWLRAETSDPRTDASA